MKRYSGKIRFIFKQVPKDEAGRRAGMCNLAGYKLDKAKGWKMYALAFDRQTDQTPGDSRGGPAGREVISAPINTQSLRQAAKCQGSRKICGGLAEGVGGWWAQQTGRADEGPQG